jgi:hypothetical protein
MRKDRLILEKKMSIFVSLRKKYIIVYSEVSQASV